MARDTHRSVLEVAREPYALTKYVAWQLQQWDRVREFERVMARFDGAKLTAFSFSDPAELEKLENRYLSQFELRTVVDEQKQQEHLRRRLAAHQRLVQIDPPAAQ